MATQSPSSPQKRLFLLWFLALVVCLAVFCQAYRSLSPDNAETSGLSSPAAGAGESLARSPTGAGTQPERAEVPAFDPDKAEYVLTAFSTQGMRHVTDAEPVWSLLRPGNILVAQLIRRGPSPEVISGKEAGAVSVRYSLDAPYAGGANAPAAGGELKARAGAADFVSDPIAVLPFTSEGVFAPYPTVTVRALDTKSGDVLAETRTVLPVSTEIGCRNCHTGPWKTEGKAGISPQTAGNILEAHDRRSNTHLREQAGKGGTVDCRACHGTAPDLVTLSAAVHGFHATMKLKGDEACGNCHASSDKGSTQFFRDFHAMWGLDCTRCHGSLEQHALSLLRAEADKGNAAAARRMTHISRSAQPPIAEIKSVLARTPWTNLPHCSGCHDFTTKPDSAAASAFNKWTKSSSGLFSNALESTGKLRCPSCHGSPHAVHPATNPAGDDRDNLQPLQYQKAAMPLGKDNNCAVCHTVAMDYFIHHDRVE